MKAESIPKDVKSLRAGESKVAMNQLVYDDPLLDVVWDHRFKVAEVETTRIRESMSLAWSKQKNSERSHTTNTSSRSRHKCPPTCDCPTTSRWPARPQSTAFTRRKKVRANGSKSQTPGPNDDEDGEDDSEPEDMSNLGKQNATGTRDIAAESSTKTCGHCQKIKKPPRGKEIA